MFFTFSGTFKTLSCIKMSLKIDKLLQRSLAFKMKARHYPIAMQSGLFGDRLIMRMMIVYVKSAAFEINQVNLLFIPMDILITCNYMWKTEVNLDIKSLSHVCYDLRCNLYR